MTGKLVSLIVRSGVVLTVILTFLCLLTPVFPVMEMINHFRPLWIICGFILVFAAYLLKNQITLYVAAPVLVLNIILLLAGLAYSGFSYLPAAAYASSPSLKLVSFNILISNKRLEKAINFFKQEKADVVVFQEIGPQHESVLRALKDIYPYQFSCSQNFSCQLAMISRRPLHDTESIRRTFFGPPVISAVVKDSNGIAVRILGTHISWPFQPFHQKTDMKWMERYIRNIRGPLIVLGDFNHTPWSWRLARFAHVTGLKRHGSFIRSWPAHKLLPLFLIDNVFSSREVVSLEMRAGPPLNSDHLPIINTILLK